MNCGMRPSLRGGQLARAPRRRLDGGDDGIAEVERVEAGERGHGVEQVLAGDRDRLADGLEELQGVLQVRRRGLGPGHRHRDAPPDERRGVGHDAHDPRLAAQPGLEPAKGEACRDRDEELARRHLGPDLVEHGRHVLGLHRQNDGLRAPHQLAVVARHLDLVRALEAPELHVDRVAGPDVLRVVMRGAQESPDQGPRHVAGADEADFLHEPSPPTEEPGRLAPGPRPPKSARPSRSNVAPSSTATGKSSLIPIERWGSSTPRRVWARSRSSRSTRKWGREASERAGAGGIAMRPSRRSPEWPRTASATSSSRSGGTPRLVPSPPTFTWTRTASERPARPTAAARAAARGAESTVCTQSKRPTAARTLLRWSPPIRCQAAAPATAARLARASWT